MSNLANTPPLSSLTTTILPTPTSSPVIDHPNVDDANCKLLGPFALVVQALMGILVLSTLVWKRQREKPRRPWKIWMLDITKQMLGQLFVHILNVLLSNLVANVGEENPCSLYFLNILIDTTLGVFIIYLTLRLTTHLLTDVWGFTGFVSGHYSDRKKRGRGKGSRPKFSFWLKQLANYFFTLLTMKVVVTILFILFPFLFSFGRWLLGLFGEAKNAQVFFVMCLFPLAMNTLQFWLVDSFLRHDPVKSKYSAVSDRENETATPGSSGVPAWGLSSHGSQGEDAPGRERRRQVSPRGEGDETHLVGEDSDEDAASLGSDNSGPGAEEEGSVGVTGSRGRVLKGGAHAYPPPKSSDGSSRRGSPVVAEGTTSASGTSSPAHVP